MGYQIVSPPGNNTQPIGLGISYVPFNGGPFTPIITTKEQAFANLKNLLLTRVGERYGYPAYGTFLLNALFEPNVVELKEDIIELISPKISQFLPGIDVQSIEVKTAEDDPNLIYHVQVSITFSINQLDTSTMNIGVNETGTVEVTGS
jgi:phage baseplate assembly protein W